MTDENIPIADELQTILDQLTTDQIRFVVARQEHAKDIEAAKALEFSPNTVKDWKYKGAPIDEAVRLMVGDGVVVALTLRRRHLAKAMAVKVAGLDSDDEALRQRVATEIAEWELGKATQPTDNRGEAIVRLVLDDLDDLID